MVKRLWQTSPPLTATGLLMLALLAGALIGLAVDPRIVTGMPAWLKPAKFAASVAIFTFTLAWIFGFLPEWTRIRRTVEWLAAVIFPLELAIINAQAWRGTTSHFNVATPLDAVLFNIMGLAIFVQAFSMIAVALALWRQRFEDAAVGWALRLGVSITIIGALTGGFMLGPTKQQLQNARAGQRMTIVGAHTVGAPDGGPGIVGTGWSTEHGDLRVPHFIGLHAMQALPLFALFLSRRRLSASARSRLTMIAAASYAAFYAIFLAQALRGESLIAPAAATIAQLGTWALFTVGAMALAVNRGVPLHTRTTV
jgi:hypothetical protein